MSHRFWLTMLMVLSLALVAGCQNSETDDASGGNLGGVDGFDTDGDTADSTGGDLEGPPGGGSLGGDNGGGPADGDMTGEVTAEVTGTTMENNSVAGNAVPGTGQTGSTSVPGNEVAGNLNNTTGGTTGDTTGTDEPAADATTEPVTIGNVELTQTVTTEDGALSVAYPDGWFAEPMLGQIVVANDQSVLDAEGMATPEADQVAISIFGSTAQAVTTGETLTPTAALTQFTGQMNNQQDTTLGEPQEMDINGRRTATVTGTQGERDLILAVAQDENGNYVMGVLTAASGTGAQYTEILQAIVAAAAYSPMTAATPGPDMTEEAGNE